MNILYEIEIEQRTGQITTHYVVACDVNAALEKMGVEAKQVINIAKLTNTCLV